MLNLVFLSNLVFHSINLVNNLVFHSKCGASIKMVWNLVFSLKKFGGSLKIGVEFGISVKF